jgi:hypothetical protein
VLLTRPASVDIDPEPNLVPRKEASTNNGPSSNPLNSLHHVAFSQASHSLQPDYHYPTITTSTCTRDPTNSCFVDPALLPPGRAEDAATSDHADCDISNWTPPHTFQSSAGTGGTHKYVDGSLVPIGAAVPQTLAPFRIDKMGTGLQPDPLANSRPLIVTEYALQIRRCSNLCSPFIRPTFHVEIMMYQNRPVVPATISGLSVVQQRREVAVWLTLDISSIPTHNAKPWGAIRISRTPSINTHREDPAGANILYIDVVVSGATNHKAYPEACRNCKERRGAGPIIDFRSKSDIIKVTNGVARAHFVFCCYPADRDEEKYYRCVRSFVPLLLLTSPEQCRSRLIREAC